MKTTHIIAMTALMIAGFAFSEEYDLRYGTIEVPEGYKLFHDGTKDSFQGRIVRSDDDFTISFDVGLMAGIAIPKQGTLISPLFFRRHFINGVPSATEIRKTEHADVIVTTVGNEVTKGIQPTNFRAILSSYADAAEFLTIVGTFKQKQ